MLSDTCCSTSCSFMCKCVYSPVTPGSADVSFYLTDTVVILLVPIPVVSNGIKTIEREQED